MRDLVFIATLLALLPLAAARPFAGVLLWSWISFMNPHRQLWNAANMPWAITIFCVTLVGCAFAGQPRRLPSNGVFVLLVALLLCFTATSVVALAPAPAVWAKWEQVAKVLVGVLLTASLLTDRWRVHALVWVMVISIGYYGVQGGIFTLATAGAYRVFGPEGTMIEDNNHLAAALLVALPLMNYLRMHSRHRIVRLGLLAAMLLTLMAALGSQSRGALVALAAAGLLMWLRSRGKLVSGVVLAACVAGAVAFMPASWTERMNTIQTYEQDQSASERLVLWGISWKLALDRPLTGSGFAGPYTREVVDRVEPGGPARAVHSIWFELLGEHGFPTFLVWLSLTLVAFRYAGRLSRLSRDRPDLAWAGDLGRMAQVSIVAYLAGGTFLSLDYWDFYWTLLAVVGATHALAVRAVGREGEAGTAAGNGRRGRMAPVPRPTMAGHGVAGP